MLDDLRCENSKAGNASIAARLIRTGSVSLIDSKMGGDSSVPTQTTHSATQFQVGGGFSSNERKLLQLLGESPTIKQSNII